MLRLFELIPDTSRRQTLLFSTTMPPGLQSVSSLVLRPDYEYIQCMDAAAPEPAINAKQSYAVVPKSEWLPRLAQVCTAGLPICHTLCAVVLVASQF